MTQHKFTLSQAAKEVGKSKSTLARYVKKGKLSASKDENGAYSIDAAELFRVFHDSLHIKQDDAINSPKKTPESNAENLLLKSKVEMLEAQLNEAKEDKKAWQEEAKNWRNQATNLLEHDKKGAFFFRLFR